jgi:menaquinone-dependent protoporphyrinogen oxidase
MKIAIVYSTKHGTTEKVASMLKDFNPEHTDIFNLNKVKDVDLSQYDKVILGGSIHAGNIQKKVKAFYEKHMSELGQKPLGLFLSCLEEEKALDQFNTAFPEELRLHSTSNKITGGEVIFEKMNFIEKFMMKKIGGIRESVSKIKHDQIVELAQEMGIK